MYDLKLIVKIFSFHVYYLEKSNYLLL